WYQFPILNPQTRPDSLSFSGSPSLSRHFGDTTEGDPRYPHQRRPIPSRGDSRPATANPTDSDTTEDGDTTKW
ncbi:unnamed protein product, partial [Brassica napus]